MSAILDISGKQFIAQVGVSFWVDSLKGYDVGDNIALRRVVYLQDESSYVLGEPFAKEAVLFFRVQEHARAKKVLVFKKKRRQGYRRLQGFRADQTRVICVAIETSAKEADKLCALGEYAKIDPSSLPKAGVPKKTEAKSSPEAEASKKKETKAKEAKSSVKVQSAEKDSKAEKKPAAKKATKKKE